MIDATQAFYILFALLALAGGIIGFVRARSRASLIAGAISCALLVLAAVLIATRIKYGLFTGLIVSVLLAGKFVPAFAAKGKFMPAGLMSALSLVSIVLTLLCWYGL